jgi:hypothetical protein
MRCYLTTTAAECKAIWKDGYRDFHAFVGMKGVWWASCQLNASDGFDGPAVLCLEIPEDVFARYECAGFILGHCRTSIIPAGVLNGIGKPQVYDYMHIAGMSRRDLVHIIRRREEAGTADSDSMVQMLREAIDFFDTIGWLTPLKVREAVSG